MIDGKSEADKISKLGGRKSHSHYQHLKSQCPPPPPLPPPPPGSRPEKENGVSPRGPSHSVGSSSNEEGGESPMGSNPTSNLFRTNQPCHVYTGIVKIIDINAFFYGHLNKSTSMKYNWGGGALIANTECICNFVYDKDMSATLLQQKEQRCIATCKQRCKNRLDNEYV